MDENTAHASVRRALDVLMSADRALIDNSEPIFRASFNAVISGKAEPRQVAALLTALSMSDYPLSAMLAGARCMRASMRKVTIDKPDEAMDIVGTGGDGGVTFNVSTSAAFVIAGCGVTVAKHGNRAFTSRSGAADMLEALGVDIEAPLERVEQAIAEAGIGFLWAPLYHSAMRHVAETRKILGFRTIFNLLGPLCNPAQIGTYLVGCWDRRKLRVIAETLGTLGAQRAWAVSGLDGTDEVALSSNSACVTFQDGKLSTKILSPSQAGLDEAKLEAVGGGDAEHNANLLRRILDNKERGACRDMVVLNAATGLAAHGRVSTLEEGARLASESIASGAAAGALARLTEIQNARA